MWFRQVNLAVVEGRNGGSGHGEGFKIEPVSGRVQSPDFFLLVLPWSGLSGASVLEDFVHLVSNSSGTSSNTSEA